MLLHKLQQPALETGAANHTEQLGLINEIKLIAPMTS